MSETSELERAKALIRKLSERTSDRGCTEHEAMEASAKIGELLEQFDLELSEVFIAEEICTQVKFFSDDDTLFGALGGIARLCSLKHYVLTGSTPTTYVMFGFQRDIELATYLWEVILEAQDVEWARYSKEHRTFQRKARDSFRRGFGNRVYRRLVELREHRDAEALRRAGPSGERSLVLVRDAKVEEEFARTGVKLVSVGVKPIRDRHAFREGYAAGNRVQIHTPINGETKSMIK